MLRVLVLPHFVAIGFFSKRLVGQADKIPGFGRDFRVRFSVLLGVTSRRIDQPATGKIADLGEFQVALRPGKYKVTINPDSDVAAKEIPAKYKSRTETPLEVEVGKGKSNFQFELSRQP